MDKNYLYKEQLRLVKKLKPKVSIIENVPELKKMKLYKQCAETVETFNEYTKLSNKNKSSTL